MDCFSGNSLTFGGGVLPYQTCHTLFRVGIQVPDNWRDLIGSYLLAGRRRRVSVSASQQGYYVRAPNRTPTETLACGTPSVLLQRQSHSETEAE